jgi:esterase/lipase superfamily enzyme
MKLPGLSWSAVNLPKEGSMNVKYFSIYSSHLKRDMSFKTYGYAGKPILAFPSSGGRFYEYEDFGMIEACRAFINSGRIMVVTPDSIDMETWMDCAGTPWDRAKRYNSYDSYIMDELVPFVRQFTGWSGQLITTGCSMGAYHAANLFFKHPDVFDTIIGLSGIYDVRYHVGDSLDNFDVYINSPVDYLNDLDDPLYIQRYRSSNIILCAGQGMWEGESLRDTSRLEEILHDKDVPAWIDYWGCDVNHDWYWWRKQIEYFLLKLAEHGKI